MTPEAKKRKNQKKKQKQKQKKAAEKSVADSCEIINDETSGYDVSSPPTAEVTSQDAIIIESSNNAQLEGADIQATDLTPPTAGLLDSSAISSTGLNADEIDNDESTNANNNITEHDPSDVIEVQKASNILLESPPHDSALASATDEEVGMHDHASNANGISDASIDLPQEEKARSLASPENSEAKEEPLVLPRVSVAGDVLNAQISMKEEISPVPEMNGEQVSCEIDKSTAFRSIPTEDSLKKVTDNGCTPETDRSITDGSYGAHSKEEEGQDSNSIMIQQDNEEGNGRVLLSGSLGQQEYEGLQLDNIAALSDSNKTTSSITLSRQTVVLPDSKNIFQDSSNLNEDEGKPLISLNERIADVDKEAPNRVSLFDETEHEPMPWETSTSVNDATQANEDSATYATDNNAIAHPMELSGASNDIENKEVHKVDLGNIENAKMPWENNDGDSHVSGKITADVSNMFNDEPHEDKPFWENGTGNVTQSATLNGGQEETHLDESVIVSEEANDKIKKFSFLENDDDLLDDNITDDGSFLESEEEIGMPSRSIEGEIPDYAHLHSFSTNVSDNAQRSESSIPAYSATREDPVSKYEPLLKIDSQQQDPQYSAHAKGIPPLTYNRSTNASIFAPPNPIQTLAPIQQPTSIKGEKFVEKFSEEKKKSDAYDFPMDLFPEKAKIGHAKPVGISTPRFDPLKPFNSRSTSSSISKPSTGMHSENLLKDNLQMETNRAKPPLSLPINPYSKAVVAPQDKMQHQAPLPAQGIVLPQVNLPSSGQPFPNQSTAFPVTRSMPLGSQFPTTLRARGISNVSTGSAGTPTVVSNNQLNPASSASSFPPAVRKASAGKYAPTSPMYSTNTHPPTLGSVTKPFPPQYAGPLPPSDPRFTGQAQALQDPHAAPLTLNVPFDVSPSSLISPSSATATRRSHARSNSSVYAPNQNEYTSKYAPTVHPQYQAAYSSQQQPGMQNSLLYPGSSVKPTSNMLNTNISTQPQISVIDEPVDNQALLHRQFPLLSWAADKLVYGIPTDAGQNAFIMGSGCRVQGINIINLDSAVPCSNFIKSFPGPLIKNKIKKRDVEKWLENFSDELPEDEVSLDRTILSLLKLKLSDSATWREVSQSLYNSDELLVYLSSQVAVEPKQKPVSSKLDSGSQMRILAHLQTGGQNEALQLALDQHDYSMALLIGSLIGKDKWSEVVGSYLTNEFNIESDISNFSTNLLSLIFQVFVGNSKSAIQEFHSMSNKCQWALDNWKLIVAAVLNNINLNSETSPSNIGKVPPVVFEFLVEFGMFLSQKDLHPQACILFLIANLPLSSSPVISNATVTFEHIGNPMSLQSAIYSELYEFSFSSDHKGFGVLLPQKLYHAFYLQEHGLTTAATRYADYLTTCLKTVPKKDPFTINLAHNLNYLSTRIAGSSTSWLGKPKLSSVWGQLDKSFNKYIGGDDDSLIKNPAGKKVFDGFTPVSSRNSSMVDVNQFQFTPYQTSIQKSSRDFMEHNPAMHSVNNSPMHSGPHFGHGHGNQQAIQRTLTAPDASHTQKIGHSLDDSPQRSQYTSAQIVNDALQPRLRRVQTEQHENQNIPYSGEVYMGASALKIYQSGDIPEERVEKTTHTSGLPLTDLVPPPQIGRTSLHYSSTPDLLRRSSALTDILPPPKFKANNGKNSAEVRSATPVYSPSVTGGIVPEAVPADNTIDVSESHENNVSKIENDDQVSRRGVDGFSQLEKPASYERVAHEVPVDSDLQMALAAQADSLNNEESDLSTEQANSTILHTELGSFESEQATWTESGNNQEVIGMPRSSFEVENSSTDGNSRPSGNRGFENREEGIIHLQHGEVIEISGDTRAAAAEDNLTGGLNIETLHTKKPYASSPTINIISDPYANDRQLKNTSPSSAIYVPQPRESNIPYKLDDQTDEMEELNSKSKARFHPIKPPETISPETFVPIIKKASKARAFTPLVVQSPEAQYDDIVEDESEDEDNEEERKLLEKQEEERRRKQEKEEEENRRKEEQKDKSEKLKEKEDAQDKANKWFSWLKKDPNEKKPIKAKLGHKSTFYYDEKLKRWVNKTASEDEKEKVSSPPPPPPVVKRMDNGPKTKPIPGGDMALAPDKDTYGTVAPRNPITGEPLPSPSPSPTILEPVNSSFKHTPSVVNSGVNLSGKKANGLDDLLNLTGGTAPRRKKKSGRGYVNVMNNSK